MEQCQQCGNEKIMYYGPWCPRCEKPEFKPFMALNLIKALAHIDTLYPEDTDQFTGYNRRFWLRVCDFTNLNNNSVVFYCFVDDYEDPSWMAPEELEQHKKVLADDNLFKEVFGIEENGVWFHASW